ncbi:MAG TPA: recombination protein O N-terminal domain-containing protein [Candidatus Paceibacterota bacterium]|nr:recombination protein O N-terminal domain-containing protein [Candidatus Paceibacterota bacterium]
MRHKYATRGVVLMRGPSREAGQFVTLLTEDLGLVRARAEGLRKPGSKLVHALQTLSESDVVLLSGKDGWRLAGAVLEENWFGKLSREGRLRAGRVASLLLRLVQGEGREHALYGIYAAFLSALPRLSEEEQDAAECLVALSMLNALGLDNGEVPPHESIYASETLAVAVAERKQLVARINRGIAASGL